MFAKPASNLCVQCGGGVCVVVPVRTAYVCVIEKCVCRCVCYHKPWPFTCLFAMWPVSRSFQCSLGSQARVLTRRCVCCQQDIHVSEGVIDNPVDMDSLNRNIPPECVRQSHQVLQVRWCTTLLQFFLSFFLFV